MKSMETTKRSEARKKLGDAIDLRSQAEAGIRNAEAALQKAKEHLYDANRALEAFHDAQKDQQDNYGVTFVNAVAAGHDIDAAMLMNADPSTESKVQNDIEIWKRTREACEKIIEDAKEGLRHRQYQVEGAVKVALAEECGIIAEELWQGLEEAHEVMRRRRAILYFASRHMRDDHPLKERIKTLIAHNADASFCDPRLPQHCSPGNHAVFVDLEEYRAALGVSADAALPALIGETNG